jgi:16S rRNA (adenine1518-N6/adenine1519-N6)-dimethyltransferase
VKASTGYSLGPHNKPLNLLKETRNILRQYSIFPKKRLGQNFVIDNSLLQSMIDFADVSIDDVVLEVGAGLGFLTRLLSLSCKKVIAVEIDPRLAVVLRERNFHLQNVELIEGDILTTLLPPFNKVVSNPPYSTSSPFLFWLLEKQFDLAVLTFQKEFAERLAAPVGSKDYSRLTVATYYRADVELLDYVPRVAFYPPPDVDSALVRLKLKPKPFEVTDENLFFQMVQIVFTQRNKKLRNALPMFLQKRGIPREKAQEIADSLIFHDKRVRQLAPEDFGALTNELVEKTNILQ